MTTIQQTHLDLYNKMLEDPAIKPHQISGYRMFLNQSFHLNIKAGSRKQTLTEPSEGKLNTWDGVFPNQKKTSQFKSVERVLEPKKEESKTEEQQIEDEIKQLGGQWHHKSGIETKKKILANLKNQ